MAAIVTARWLLVAAGPVLARADWTADVRLVKILFVRVLTPVAAGGLARARLALGDLRAGRERP